MLRSNACCAEAGSDGADAAMRGSYHAAVTLSPVCLA